MTRLVIGKSGQLAQEIQQLEPTVVCLSRFDLDILSEQSVNDVLGRYQPTCVINASAYTAVDKAESDAEQAYAVNHLGVANLAKYAAANSAQLVHISTDYVFAGNKGSPYLVEDEIAPIGVYGASKAAGERALRDVLPQQSCIIRTSWVYSTFGNNFVKTMLRLMNEKSELGVIDDQIGSPTSAQALAETCLLAARNRITGTHHFTDSGVCSWYDFACAIQQLGLQYNMIGKTIPIKPIPTSAYPTPAKRPSYSVMDKSSLQRDFDGLIPRHWRVELERVIARLAQNKNSIKS